jgi:heat shock protein HslJ
MAAKHITRLGMPRLFLLAILAACGKDPSTVPPREPPSWEDLKKATYYGLQLPGAPIELQDGVWERVRTRVTLAADFRAVGDLSGDGHPDAVVILAESGGGSGTYNYLAVVGYRNDRMENLATAPLGDRVQVKSVRIEPGKLAAEVVQAGPGDPACCPGDLVTRYWRYSDAGLQELPPGESRRFNLAALEGSQWTLHSLDLATPAAKEPPVTLTIMENGFSGSTGCNSYSAAATSGEMGALKVAEPIASKLPCAGDAAAVERQFLEALGKVDSMSFLSGRLLLNYLDANRPKALSFDPVQP